MNSNSNYSRTARKHKASSSGDFLSLLIFYILPFIIINSIIFFLVTSKPAYELSVGATKDYRTTDVTLKLQSFLPVKNIIVTFETESIEMIKSDKKTYTTTLSKNGILEVSIENFNGMITNTYEQINILDDTPPAINNEATEDGILTFQLEDTQSGIDYSTLYALDADEKDVKPLRVNEQTGEIKFGMETDELHIFAKDLSGNEVRAHVTSSKNGLTSFTDDETEGTTQENTAETEGSTKTSEAAKESTSKRESTSAKESTSNKKESSSN